MEDNEKLDTHKNWKPNISINLFKNESDQNNSKTIRKDSSKFIEFYPEYQNS